MKPSGKLAFSVLEEFSQGAIDTARVQKEAEQRIAYALDQGYQRGVANGRAEAQAEFDRRLADLKERFELELGSVEQAWKHDTGARLHEELQMRINMLSELVENRVAALIKPWLSEEIYNRAVADFQQTVTRAITEGSAVEISGPEALILGVKEHIGGKPRNLLLTPSDDASITVKIDDGIISANFTAWMAMLEGHGHE